MSHCASLIISVGQVLMIDPETVRALGASCTLYKHLGWMDMSPITGTHPFIVIDRTSTHCACVPSTSKGGPGRIAIPRVTKTGHPAWVETQSFWLPQLWIARFEALLGAAVRLPNGHDLNRVTGKVALTVRKTLSIA
jgi:hypothetical protein